MVETRQGDCATTQSRQGDDVTRPPFKDDLQQQGQKLMAVLALAVRGLDRPETILEAVQRLGQRHAGYGVQPHHYATVGEASLWTLAQVFGPAFTDDVQNAWAAACGLLATILQEAAGESHARAPIREASAVAQA